MGGGVQNNLKILGSTCVSRPRSSARHRSSAAAVLRLGNSAWDVWGLIVGPGIFWGFVGSHTDFSGF